MCFPETIWWRAQPARGRALPCQQHRDEGDARKFAAAVEAEAIGSHPGWASQRAFALDSATLAELEASLPAPRTRPRQGQMEQS